MRIIFSKFAKTLIEEEEKIEELRIIIEQIGDKKELNKARIDLENIIKNSKLDYIKRIALNVLYKGKVFKKIKRINFQNFLLEVYENLDLYIENVYFLEYFIKYYFYEKIYDDSDELHTEELFNLITNEENKSTLLYYFSIYKFSNLNFSEDGLKNRNELLDISDNLLEANKLCENRQDIKIYFNLVKFMEKLILNDHFGIESEYQNSKKNLEEYLIFSINENRDLEKKIILIMKSLVDIDKKIKAEKTWLNYEEELYSISYSLDTFYNKKVEKELEESLNIVNSDFIKKLIRKKYERELVKLVPKIHHLLNISEHEIHRKVFIELLREIEIEKGKIELDEWLSIIQKSFNIFQKNSNSKVYEESITNIIKDNSLNENEKFYEILDVIEESIEIKQGYRTGSVLGEEILNDILDTLKNKYEIKCNKELIYFSNIISLILKFINNVGKTPKKYFPIFYKDFKRKLLEDDFQKELYNWLLKSDYANYFDLETSSFADGGRVDITFTCDGLKIPIEIKKTENKNITTKSIENDYIAQAQTYTYLYNRLGFFILFDLSEKEKDYIPNNLRDTVRIHSLEPHLMENNYPNVIVSFVIPAKRILPSEKSKYK